jgi:hypothetical protein
MGIPLSLSNLRGVPARCMAEKSAHSIGGDEPEKF